MRAQPVPLELLRPAGRDLLEREARCIRRDDGPIGTVPFDSGQELLLGFQGLDDRLDDPVRAGYERQLVKASGLNQLRGFRKKKRGRLDGPEALEAHAGQICRMVEQHDREACIC